METKYTLTFHADGSRTVVPTSEHIEHMQKLDVLFSGIDKLLADTDMLERIGNYTFDEFAGLFSHGMCWDSEKRLATIYGHKVEVIRYYCDTFNDARTVVKT